jgi:putative phosphoribosyl transferase
VTTTVSTGVAREGRPAQAGRPSRFTLSSDNVVGARSRSVTVESDGVALPGDLTIPGQAIAVVVFAHGSGSSRRSPRNVRVADRLHREGLGTLLFDLLTDAEAEERRKAFDIELLARRLGAAVGWVRGRSELDGLPVDLFGASTGAAAALVVAAATRNITAIVSRGGRPDLAGEALGRVTAPTLFVVGGLDREVLGLNRAAQARMRCETRLEIVPGATHLFEEPGGLDRVAELAAAWFMDHVG